MTKNQKNKLAVCFLIAFGSLMSQRVFAVDTMPDNEELEEELERHSTKL
ncbi:MAG: hypothetical protein K2P90_00505 [Holosporales bacterium]|nr:hypothetical protein [Holosporales bacterium]